MLNNVDKSFFTN